MECGDGGEAADRGEDADVKFLPVSIVKSNKFSPKFKPSSMISKALTPYRSSFKLKLHSLVRIRR